MGPKPGTPEYKQQVETIVTALGSTPMKSSELPQFLMLYILDPSFSRGAISEAEKKLRSALGKSGEQA
jgi:hypothetical protein